MANDTCPHCGTALPAVRDVFCGNCRKPLLTFTAPPPPPPAPVPATPPRPSAQSPFKVFGWGGAVVGALMAGGGESGEAAAGPGLPFMLGVLAGGATVGAVLGLGLGTLVKLLTTPHR